MVDFHDLTERLERIYTTRLALRQVAMADAWPLFDASRNPRFNRYLLWDQPENERVVLDRVQAILEASRRGKLSAVSAVVKETGAWVSLFRFQPFEQTKHVIEMGIWTHHTFWHGSYSLELGRACIAAAFSFSEVDELLGAASPSNRSSCRLMEMCGMAPGRMVRRATEGGGTSDLLEHRITRGEWTRQRADREFLTVDAVADRADAVAAEVRATATVARADWPDLVTARNDKRRITVEPLQISIPSGVKVVPAARMPAVSGKVPLAQVDNGSD